MNAACNQVLYDIVQMEGTGWIIPTDTVTDEFKSRFLRCSVREQDLDKLCEYAPLAIAKEVLYEITQEKDNVNKERVYIHTIDPFVNEDTGTIHFKMRYRLE